MITNDATLLKVKHEVLYEVAKLAYAGRLEECSFENGMFLTKK